ncbi:hypothetical protein C1I95_24735 [Micromonospora craterilacus]|uniref:Uncharacterized protein n=1 Tax=Micromonospora craterilacus TaxID=1655439 RepID=A0A2W2DLX2_9ACTN|nr:hypothetical protein [Micromonospora craterilacus]PZG12952.1 hypothetical protein C1I95_24735 [Micromonospora craterilacus]
MTVRAVVTRDILGVAVQIGRQTSGGTLMLRFTEDTAHLAEGRAWPEPSLRMDEDVARALYDALAEHFGHAAGGRQQRADFEHERGRVDRLIGMVGGALTAAQAGQLHGERP